MVPAELVKRWEIAYGRYRAASTLNPSSSATDPNAARSMAATSLEVAAAWREIEREATLPWWALAAVCAAAQAYELQAREWQTRAEHSESPAFHAQPRHLLSTRAQPRPRPGGSRKDSWPTGGDGDEYG